MNDRIDRIEVIENSNIDRAQFCKNYGAFEFKLTREQVGGLLEGKAIAFDINDREYTRFSDVEEIGQPYPEIS